MNIEATEVYEWNDLAVKSEKRFIINQGGSRSSKTYSLCQLVIVYALTHPYSVTSIVRKTFPALRATVMRDFFEVMQNLGIYSQKSHNKSEHTYRFSNGAIVEFFSVDDEQKVRGRKRSMCWMNEANELLYEDFFQLNLRTEGKMIIDFNPSEIASWIYQLPDIDSTTIISTYKNNPFLPKSIVKEIEALKDSDEELYNVYALGQRVQSRELIFTGWTASSSRPDKFTKYVYGLDFGFNHPTALTRVWFHENDRFIEPLIFQSYLTSADLIELMKQQNIEKSIDILCDGARPEMIREMQLAGFAARSADKSVKKGIDLLKVTKNTYLNNSDLEKELENYRWKKVANVIQEEPVKAFDDILDSIRYANTFISTYLDSRNFYEKF